MFLSTITILKKIKYLIPLLFLLWSLWPAKVALAQGPTFCGAEVGIFEYGDSSSYSINGTQITIYPNEYLSASFGELDLARITFSQPVTLTLVQHSFVYVSSNYPYPVTFYNSTNSWSSPSRYTIGSLDTLITNPISTQSVYVLQAYPANGKYITFECVGYEPPVTPATCDLIQNADFTEEDSWLLQGATIQSGTLVLDSGDIAAQNLDELQDFTTYNAAIEVSQVSGGQAALDVVLGADSSTLLVDEAGSYTATLTTPDIGGPLAFGLENAGGGTLTIDYICLSVDPSGGQHSCLAPSNGEFTTESGWDFYRGASWSSISENVLLPANDQGLLIEPNNYELPALAQGEYLLLSYDARKSGQGSGMIAHAAVTLESNFSAYVEVFEQTYTFESDISTLADQTLAQLAFANAADDNYTSDLVIDDVCVFVSNQPAKLPYPTDPNQITNPVTVNGIGSCDEVDSIWASFGVNMAQYRASYAAGASVWEPGGWVPWLVAAVFVTLSDWSCMFMAAYLSILETIAHLINNILNIWQWIEMSFTNFVAWLSEWGMWVWLSGDNILGEIGSASIDWAEWFNDTFTGFPLWLLLFPNAIGTWIGYELASIFFEFVGGWNAAMGLFNAIYNLLVDPETNFIDPTYFAAIDALVPGGSYVLLVVWAVTELTYLFFDLVWYIGDFIYFFVAWIWENVVTMGYIPLNFYYAFYDGAEEASWGSLISCTGQTSFWCAWLAGVEMVNRTISHTILYPIVIVGIIGTTLVILWRNMDDLFTTYTS